MKLSYLTLGTEFGDRQVGTRPNAASRRSNFPKIPKITAMNEIAGDCAAGFAFKPGYVTLGNCRLLEIGKIGKFSMRGKVCPVRYFDFTEEKSYISEPRPPRPL
jgi:hypothetical protein